MVNERVTVTKEVVLHMAHALQNYEGNCRYIHGHSYRLQVSVSGIIQQNPNQSACGMVMDFKVLKDLIMNLITSQYDHALVLNDNLANEDKLMAKKLSPKVHFTPFQPTCENLLVHFKNLLQSALNDSNLQLSKVKLFETESSWATWEYTQSATN